MPSRRAGCLGELRALRAAARRRGAAPAGSAPEQPRSRLEQEVEATLPPAPAPRCRRRGRPARGRGTRARPASGRARGEALDVDGAEGAAQRPPAARRTTRARPTPGETQRSPSQPGPNSQRFHGVRGIGSALPPRAHHRGAPRAGPERRPPGARARGRACARRARARCRAPATSARSRRASARVARSGRTPRPRPSTSAGSRPRARASSATPRSPGSGGSGHATDTSRPRSRRPTASSSIGAGRAGPLPVAGQQQDSHGIGAPPARLTRACAPRDRTPLMRSISFITAASVRTSATQRSKLCVAVRSGCVLTRAAPMLMPRRRDRLRHLREEARARRGTCTFMRIRRATCGLRVPVDVHPALLVEVKDRRGSPSGGR